MSIKIDINHVNEKDRSTQKIHGYKTPEFAEYKPDIQKINKKVSEHSYENLVVIGNGGSITTFRAYLYAFIDEVDIDVRIVTTTDPDYLNRISNELKPENTLVMPISKSGDTLTVIESLLYFLEKEYPVFAVTSEKEGALKQIIEKQDLEWIKHPDIGGRFAGLTETALVPAAFAGIDVEEIRKGAEQMYEQLKPGKQYNPALNTASTLKDAEDKGYTEVMTPFYSTKLFGFYPLFVQLMHETVCKNNKGQTVYGDLGPEIQHHTNQRLFGGRQNVIPFFFNCEAYEKATMKVPENLEQIEVQGEKLGQLNGQEYKKSVKSEYETVKKSLDQQEKPSITLTVSDISHRNIGKLVALLQYTAVYSAWLRDVNPFSQPDVQKTKEQTFESRLSQD